MWHMHIEALYELFIQSTGVNTDSRTLQPGQMFFALKGPNFDANRFAQQALDQESTAIVIDNADHHIPESTILVDDVLASLQQLARYHRQQMPATVIAITGSNGKTTSKELAHRVLASTFSAYATEGNLNNHIGLPLTLLRIKPEHQYAIVELGDNHPGEIALLCSLGLPDIGAVTNVGMDHLEGFGSMEANIATKKELYDYLLKSDKPTFLQPEQPYLVDMAAGIRNVHTYGTREEYKTFGKLLRANPYVKFAFRDNGEMHEVQTQLPGAYNMDNLMLAVAIGQHFGVEAKNIAKALASFIPTNNRSQVVSWGTNHILLDAYNANPSNVEAALQSLAAMDVPHKVAILGDMLELGTFGPAEHERIGKLAVESADEVVLVGPQFVPVAAMLGLQHFATATEAAAWVRHQVFANSWILIKGSRGIGLEALMAGLG